MFMLHSMTSPGRRGIRVARSALSGSLLAGGLLTGCAVTEEDGSPAGPEDTLVTAAAITNTDFTDGSGRIRIRVKTCDPTAAATTNCAYCTADDGWVRIGGGAQILGENNPGAMLQASFPSPNFFTAANDFGCTGPAGHSPPRLGIDDKSTWVVRASGATHQLQAYVIQMQLVDAAGNAFTPSVTEGLDYVTNAVNPPSNYTVETPESWLLDGYFLIGGGARVLSTNPADSVTAATDAYLVESRPVDGPNGRVWRASARARSSPAHDNPLKSYAIGVKACPPQWDSCLTYPMIKEITAAATSGYGTATYTISPSWVGSSVGGYAPTTSSGARFLADLIPFNGTAKGFTVRSRDDGTGGSGQTFGSTLVFGHLQGLYTFNAVFFSRGANPAILRRPTGTDPQLQAAYSTADQPATRWHLEAFGTGTFRLRNGNPDGGTECAYRDGTTSNVRVKACGTGNEFMWTVIGNFPSSSTFQLQNATNGQCLDTNGSATPTNMVLKPCVTTGDPTYQLLYVDNYNWPN
ncbi:hypothetical protein WME95_05830 [Sorangium sp. So ce327]|uniref:RICIN domain-containing protein n=1 Tax=Sorangium sp. So ce327 TaxID=3133301 RepID=UPI003F62A8A9